MAHPAEELHVVTLEGHPGPAAVAEAAAGQRPCLLYTSDAADERSSVELGGRRIIKKKKKIQHWHQHISEQ